MFPRFPTSHRQAAFTSGPIEQVPRRRQPFHGEPAFRLLAPGTVLSAEHSVSTGEPRVRHAQWIGRNTVDIGIVNEDVEGVTLSGPHTFRDDVLNRALEAQRDNPGLILCLGIPPNNPQKYVQVERRLERKARTGSASAMPSSIPPAQRPGHHQPASAGAEGRAERARHPAIRGFTADAARTGGNQAGPSIAAPRPRAFTPAPRAGLQPHGRGDLPVLPVTLHGGSNLPRTRPVTDRRLRLSSSSSSPTSWDETSTSSTGRTGRLPEAGTAQEPTRSTAPVNPYSRGADQAGPSFAAPQPRSFAPALRAGFQPHGRGNFPVLSGSLHGRSNLQHNRAVTDRRLPPGSSSSSSSSRSSSSRETSASAAGRNATLFEAGAVLDPPPLSVPVDWTHVRAAKALKEQQAAAVVPEREPSWRERQRNVRRAEQGIAPRTGKTAVPAPARLSASGSSQFSPDSILGIHEQNMHAVATKMLRRAAGIVPGERGSLERQNEWVDSLNRTWNAYQPVAAVRRGEASRQSEAWLWQGMRYSLRELLYISLRNPEDLSEDPFEDSNVFGLSRQAYPVTDEELNAFVSSRAFELLVTAVNDVHGRLRHERTRRSAAVEFADSSQDS